MRRFARSSRSNKAWTGSDPAAAQRPRARLARRAVSRGVGLLALTALFGGVLAAPSFADFLHFPIKAPVGGACTEASGQFGERTASAGVGATPDAGADFTTVPAPDGVNDVWMAQPSCDLTYANQGRVYLLSGKDFRTGTTNVIRTIDSPVPQADARFGFAISVIGDVTGDSKDDIAIGTDSQDVSGNVDQGKAWVFNGNTGALVYTLDNPVPQGSARFGSRIGRAGDIVKADGTAGTDGKPEIIVGASNNDVPAPGFVDQGQAFIFNGANGGLVRTLNIPAGDAMTKSHFGLSVQGPGDVTGDGVPDQLVDAENFTGGLASQGRMYLFSGADGTLFRTINDPTPQAGAYFGFQDVVPLSPGDLDGDTKAEYYANGFLQDVGSPSVADEGEAWVFDGATGNVKLTLLDPSPEVGGQFGWSMSKTNYNGGANDLYVGQSPHVTGTTTQDGGTYVFDGTTGSVLKSLELPTACHQAGATGNNGPALGWTVSTPGDVSGDAVPDYVAGAPFFDRSFVDEGVVLAFLSGKTPNPTKAC